MDTMSVINSFGSIFKGDLSGFSTLGTALCLLLFQHKILISGISLIIVLLYRIVMANFLWKDRKKRRLDKKLWIAWGILFAYQVVVFLISNPAELWLGLQVSIWLIVFLSWSILRGRQIHIAKGMLEELNVIISEDRNKTDEDNNKVETIKHRYSLKKCRIVKGIPLFAHKFKFRYSPQAEEGQFAKMIERFATYYDDYNWEKIKDGNKMYVIGDIKDTKATIIKVPESLHQELPWYMIPVGAIDASTKQSIKETPYVWRMQDPKKEGKVFKSLEKTTEYPSHPQGMTVGSTGGGKSSLVNTMISHWLYRAKNYGEVELYLADAKEMEFTPYRPLEEVKEVAVTLPSATKMLERFVRLMKMRNKALAYEGKNEFPFDGRIQLEKLVHINDVLVPNEYEIECKLTNGEITTIKAEDLVGRTDVEYMNVPQTSEEIFGSEDEEDDEEEESGGMGGRYW